MIEWSVNPEIFSIGPLAVRWYGLLFAMSFFIGFQIMTWIFKLEKRSEKDLNDLVWYMIAGTVVGARIGHCLFYSPGYYLSNPLEILALWHGGLASHGAAVGILIVMYYYTKTHKGINYLWVFDRVVVTVALAAFFIRMGNLFNSEIYGKPTDGTWGFIFKYVDNVPRHPTQLYEALAYLAIFVFLFFYYKKNYKTLKEGAIFGYFLIGIFGFRIFVEYFKENQEAFESSMPLNMGQLLSIPLVIAGVIILFRAKEKIIEKPKNEKLINR